MEGKKRESSRVKRRERERELSPPRVPGIDYFEAAAAAATGFVCIRAGFAGSFVSRESAAALLAELRAVHY